MLAALPAVAANGFEVFVAGPSAGPLADTLKGRGISQVAWQTHERSGQRRPLAVLREDLAQILRRNRPDLLHANSLSTARIAGPTAVECAVRSIGHLRDIVKLSAQAIADVSRHNRLLAVSHATREFHVAQGIAAEKCVALHNGVDLDAFCPRPRSGYLQRELNLPAEARLVASIGQVSLRKGTDEALLCALEIAPGLPEVHWLIVGERTSTKDEARDFEALVRRIAAEPLLAGRVHFLGQRDDVSRLLPECDLLVHAARQEPLGRVLLEAAASGVPVVARDVGGNREIFPSETDGAILVERSSQLTFSQAVHTLLRNEGRRKSLGAAGRQRAETAFDIRSAAARLIEQYRAVLDEGA